MQSDIRQEAERTQAKRVDYITALRSFLSGNEKLQEEKRSVEHKRREDDIRMLHVRSIVALHALCLITAHINYDSACFTGLC